jgi:hypothetical protein
MQLDSSILSEFKKITGKDISSYFSNAVSFFNGDYITIVDYYSGNTSSISSEPFANFKVIQKQNKDILESFKEHSRQFNNLKWWLLIEQIEEIDSRLATLSNINKWSRSSLSIVGYDPSFQLIMLQGRIKHWNRYQVMLPDHLTLMMNGLILQLRTGWKKRIIQMMVVQISRLLSTGVMPV